MEGHRGPGGSQPGQEGPGGQGYLTYTHARTRTFFGRSKHYQKVLGGVRPSIGTSVLIQAL